MGESLAGKSGIVTGGGRGIGRATALAFARRAAAVAVVDLDLGAAEETVAAIEAEEGTALAIGADVADEADVCRMVAEAAHELGGISFAHNNAGIVSEQAPTHETPRASWDRVLAVNLTGVYLCMREEIPHLLERGGAIVNTASTGGLVGVPGIGPYIASKHGVVGLTRAAALEYADSGVRINAVCPGWVRTPMSEASLSADPATYEALLAAQPMSRMGGPEELAEAVVWLCSGGASFVTGAALAVDGGITAM